MSNTNIHIALPAKNLEASVAFYERLGFSVERDYLAADGQLHITRLSNQGEFVLELMSHPEARDMAFDHRPELHHIGVAVENLEQTLQKLAELNVAVIKPITAGTAVQRYAFVADPSGFPVELFEPKKN